MYLKTIKAYGFKSFADKTEIHFGQNINGIVGPNGSGKSNVVDAVRWVLGEQSIKSLRGENSSDVIFSGSKSRKALNSASVTLIFDNSDLYLPVSYTEVSVKRVMYRTGENEYYLNQEKCRLKDITNLLTDTGADKESFNIIGQGKIDEILSTKPGERRLVFESAAGVLKYKKRKEEAIKKLERTNGNIDRVNDILKELESNLSPLEKQSKDAKKYLEYKEELTSLEVSLMVHDIRILNHQTKELTRKIDTLKDELIKLSNTHSTYDIELLEKKDQIKGLGEEIAQTQKVFIENTKNIEKIDGNIRVLKERKKYSSTSTEDINQILLTLKEQILKIEVETNTLKNDLVRLQIEDQELQLLARKYSQKYQTITDHKHELNSELEKNSQDIVNTKYKIEYLEDNIQNGNAIPSAIQNILNNQRLSGIHNIVGKLIDMDSTYVNAISIALGGAFYYLVVDTANTAKVLVHYLKDHKLGRATFLPIDVMKKRTIDETFFQKIKSMEGFIAVASSVVQYQDTYQNIILNLLGNVIIAQDLESANQISKAVMHRYKVVTLDGQLVNVGGSITGGSLRSGKNFIQEQYDLETQKLEYQTLLEKSQNINQGLEQNRLELEELEAQLYVNKSKHLENQETQKKIQKNLEELFNQKDNLSREMKDREAISNHHTDSELEGMLQMYYSAIANKDNISAEIENLQNQKQNLEQRVLEIEELSRKDQHYISNKEKLLKEWELRLNTTNVQLDHLLISLGEEYNMTYEAATSQYQLEIEEELARSQVKELKSQIKQLGYVNINSIEEYERLKTRYEFLIQQKEDLREAEDTLLKIIQEMDEVMKQKFLSTFEAVRVEFKKVFREMFHGGEAELLMTEPDNVLETGIEIQAIPSGKNLKSISLLSGGEKTFTAISLLFAILNVRPVPFCLLDEVEAALDDANVESFGNYLYKYQNTTQFILITHKKKIMEYADILYGITMQESGVSKLVSVRLEDLEQEK